MDYIKIHEKWRDFWRENKTNAFNPQSKKPKYYCLEMFSYPSGASLHIGHYFNYAPSDTHARFKRMCGYNVFQPMGFDAFGLPAENHAIKTNTHPQDNTQVNMGKMTQQLDELGGMYDWDYTFATCYPEYYKWTQWLFLKLYNAGLAYQKEQPVNWCDKCKTVLANEQVIGGACERCETVIERRNMKQWFFKITDYAEKLLDGLDGLDWPNKTKSMQKNWIGKSTGEHIIFKSEKIPPDIEVFTTRPDTIKGVTFMAVAPEHLDVMKFITHENKTACVKYIAEAARKDDVERQSADKAKTGVFTGSYVINPITNEKIPVWIADYVLGTYGTGAVMGVPAYDERDKNFANTYQIPINVAPLYNKSVGKKAINYRLRDWSVSRQRYWGAPIPIIHCENCGIVPVPEKDLPVKLPYIKDFKPRGAAPLANDPEFLKCTCPKCGRVGRRECETMDTFVCSSWYFLRYPFAKRDDIPFDRSVFQVNKYVGGAEHSCGHLIYARFINRFLYDQGLVPFAEPFPSLVHQGMILAHDGQKMSKSKGNTVSPDEYVNKYGSDILRLFMEFGFNYTEGGAWNESTLKTVTRFTTRIENVIGACVGGNCALRSPTSPAELLHIQATTIKSVREDLENFSFNTAVARCMEFLNAIEKNPVRECVENLVLLIAPMMPHLAEEYWEMLGNTPSIFNHPYPEPNEKYLVKNEIEIAVQINSKIVARLVVPSNSPQGDVEKLCAQYLQGKTIKKAVYIQNRLINFIV
jgi:leucyl-tRNA synthetase